MNDETMKSIKKVKSVITKRCTFACDREHDANVLFNYFIDDNNKQDDFIIRLKKQETYYLKRNLKMYRRSRKLAKEK